MAGIPSTTWTNNDGIEVRYGNNQGKRAARAGVTTGSGKVRELVLHVDLTTLGAGGTSFNADPGNTGTTTGFSGLDTLIPTGALIVSQRVYIQTALAGGTNYAVGDYTVAGATGTAVNSFRTTAGADGSLIGTLATANLYVGVVVTGTYTAGVIEIVISYMT